MPGYGYNYHRENDLLCLLCHGEAVSSLITSFSPPVVLVAWRWSWFWGGGGGGGGVGGVVGVGGGGVLPVH